MLIEFSIGNYRSFKEITTFSMLAADITAEESLLYDDNFFEARAYPDAPTIKLLRSQAVFGANAAGKSNLVKAFHTFTGTVLRAVEEKNWLTERIEPFALHTKSSQEPTFFQLIFILDNTYYRYGFEATQQKIVSEWLYEKKSARESYLFTREGAAIKVNPRTFSEAKRFESNTKIVRDNSLFLSAITYFKEDGIAADIVQYINHIGIVSDLDEIGMVVEQYWKRNETNRAKIIDFLRQADTGIEDIVLNEKEASIPDSLKQMIEAGKIALDEPLPFKSKRKIYNEQGKVAAFLEEDFNHIESEGTQEMLRLSPFVFDTLEHGKVLVIDEFDALLHPKLSRIIVSLFNEAHTNPHNAQLIFTTHNVNLLSPYLLRPDQICFVEKDRFGATGFSALSDYEVAAGEPYEKKYLRGSYGALPKAEGITELVEKTIANPE